MCTNVYLVGIYLVPETSGVLSTSILQVTPLAESSYVKRYCLVQVSKGTVGRVTVSSR